MRQDNTSAFSGFASFAKEQDVLAARSHEDLAYAQMTCQFQGYTHHASAQRCPLWHSNDGTRPLQHMEEIQQAQLVVQGSMQRCHSVFPFHLSIDSTYLAEHEATALLVAMSAL